MARTALAVVVSISRSKSWARRRLRLSQATVRSITQRRGSEMEAFGVTWSLDDLEPQSLASGGVEGDVALVAGIGEQVLEPRKRSADSGAGQRQAVAVLNVAG